MEPTDFTQHGQVRPASADALRLRARLRGLMGWSVAALLAWFGLAALLAGMDLIAAGKPLQSAQDLLQHMASPSFSVPMRTLASMTGDTLFWPLVVVVSVLLLRGLLGEFLIRRLARAAPAPDEQALPPDHGEQVTERSPDGAWRLADVGLQALWVVPVAATAFGGIWAVMAAFAHADGQDPWEALPWVTPPYLAAFLARHPGLTVGRDADTGGQLTFSNGRGQTLRLHGSEVARSELRLGPCPQGLGPEQLGGITPYPGMRCDTHAQLRGPDVEQWIYLFSLARGSDGPAMEAHFRRWIDSHASGSAMSSGAGRLTLSAGSTDDAWHMEVQASQGGASTLRVRHRQ